VTALPKRFYGDPSENVDELRKLREVDLKRKDKERVHKRRRIRALVKQVMKNGGGGNGK
jgi:hypothetical protein